MSEALTTSMTIKFDHRGPIELMELTEALTAVGQDFRYWADRSGDASLEPGTRLYVREIRAGSIIVEMIALASALRPAIEGGLSILAFAKDVSSALRYFQSGEGTPPATLDGKRAEHLSRLLAPVAETAGNSLTISTGDGSPVSVTQIFLDSNNANAAQNRARQLKALEARPVEGVHTGVLFYWFQVRDQRESGGVGDRGVIESIAPYPVKVRFADESLKQPMLGEALFTRAYVVDVRAETVRGKVMLYTILALQESFERE